MKGEFMIEKISIAEIEEKYIKNLQNDGLEVLRCLMINLDRQDPAYHKFLLNVYINDESLKIKKIALDNLIKICKDEQIIYEAQKINLLNRNTIN